MSPLYKAVKLDVMVLVDTHLSNDEIKQCMEDAMLDYCFYYASMVKIMEVYEGVGGFPKEGDN